MRTNQVLVILALLTGALLSPVLARAQEPALTASVAGPRLTAWRLGLPTGSDSTRLLPSAIEATVTPMTEWSRADAEKRRRSSWLFPLVGAVTGGAIMAGYISYVCHDTECNLSPVPFVVAGTVLGGFLGFMIGISL